MRWLIGVAAALVLAVAAYLGSAVVSLNGLVEAARAGDGSAVLARSDTERLRRSLVDQIVAAYLERTGRTKPLARMIANTYGASVADAVLAKLLTAENLTRLLRTGEVPGVANAAATTTPAIGAIDTSRLLDLLGRLQFIQLRELGIRTSETSDSETASAISIHFEGTEWKLSGIMLPKAVARQMAAGLPVK